MSIPSHPRRVRRTVVAIVVLAFGASGLGACSSESSNDAQSANAGSMMRNDADVTFVKGMIPHHQQAVVMADIALQSERAASADVDRLAQQIKAAQDPEIGMINGWLKEWNMSADNHDGHDMANMESMDGMASNDDLASLRTLSGSEFDQLWLDLMIAHHTGAISTANKQCADGSDDRVKQLSKQIIDAQQDEIDQMRLLMNQP